MLIHKAFMNVDEVAIARLLAARRYENNRAAGVVGYRNTTNLPELRKETRSILGEWGLCKILGIYPPTSQDISEAGTSDLILSGTKIEVKTAPADDNKDLNVNVASFGRYRDLYVLLDIAKIRRGALVYFVGYTKRGSVAAAEIVTAAATPFYSVPRIRLNDNLDEFREEIIK